MRASPEWLGDIPTHAEALAALIDLIICYPKVGIPLLLAVLGFMAVSTRTGGDADWDNISRSLHARCRFRLLTGVLRGLCLPSLPARPRGAVRPGPTPRAADWVLSKIEQDDAFSGGASASSPARP